MSDAKPTYEDAILRASILEWVMDTLEGREICDFGLSFPEVEVARQFRQANAALVEVERRIREFSPKLVDWMKKTNAPKEVTEAYKWAIYGSAIHAQIACVKPANTEF